MEAIEAAFGMLSKGKVDVPIPMHIGIDESDKAGPGDCHIKGGYIFGTTTWTVKLANVSFYKNLEKVCSSHLASFLDFKWLDAHVFRGQFLIRNP